MFCIRPLSWIAIAVFCAACGPDDPLPIGEDLAADSNPPGGYDRCAQVLQGDLFNKVTQNNFATASARKMAWQMFLTMSEDEAYSKYSQMYDKARSEHGGGSFSFMGFGGGGEGGVENKVSRSEFGEAYQSARSMNSGSSSSSAESSSTVVGQYATYIRDPETIKAWTQCVLHDSARGLYAYGSRDASGVTYVNVVWAPGDLAVAVPRISVKFQTPPGMTVNAPANLEVAPGSGVSFVVTNADRVRGFEVHLNGTIPNSAGAPAASYTATANVPPAALNFKIPTANLVQDPGFEQSRARELPQGPWFGEGGVDIGKGLQLEGANNGFVWSKDETSKWRAINQWIQVKPRTTYVAKAWIRTSEKFGDGYFSARADNPFGSGVINEVKFKAMPAAYREVQFELNSGPNSRILLYAGFWSPPARPDPIRCRMVNGRPVCSDRTILTEAWLQIDNVSLKEKPQ